jgi:hypothetical protein
VRQRGGGSVHVPVQPHGLLPRYKYVRGYELNQGATNPMYRLEMWLDKA